MSQPGTANFRGVIPVIVTPFGADGGVDWRSLEQCVQFAAVNQFDAICLPAYASEFQKLSETERLKIVETAVGSAGATAVIGQCNHPSADLAAESARRYEQLGAGCIGFALPRQFAMSEQDLFDYSRRICDATRLPVLIQDFNPGGPTIGESFVERLHGACGNFRYVKLEQPLMGRSVRSILKATDGAVGVLEGWGGLYTIELMQDGICGLMPGLGAADVLQRIWHSLYAGDRDVAIDIFQGLLPQLVFTLQHLDLWIFAEKKLLAARGIIPEASTYLRQLCRMPSPNEARHALWLNERLLKLLDRLELPRNPLSA